MAHCFETVHRYHTWQHSVVALAGKKDSCYAQSMVMGHIRIAGKHEGLVVSSSVESADLEWEAAEQGSLLCYVETKVEICAWLQRPDPLAGKHYAVRSVHQMGYKILLVVLALVALPVYWPEQARRKDCSSCLMYLEPDCARHLENSLLTACWSWTPPGWSSVKQVHLLLT
jgi:hypothetical protein